MEWLSIESQADLDKLEHSVCWEDSNALEYYASPANRPYFPSDIAKSGWVHKNLHVLVEACSSQSPFLELVFIDCDHIGSNALEAPHLGGRVDQLKCVEIYNAADSMILRCSRLIFRWLPELECARGAFFRVSDSIPGDVEP